MCVHECKMSVCSGSREEWHRQQLMRCTQEPHLVKVLKRERLASGVRQIDL
jgi:hypothetical protein